MADNALVVCNFRLRNVEYELHADGEYVEISQNGTSIARLPCTNR